MRFGSSSWRLSLLMGAAIAASATAASADGAYLRTGVGFDWSQAAIFSDRDCNASPPLPALFGCSNGNDGLPIGAYGSFGGSPAFEIGAGLRVGPAMRVELTLSHRPHFAFVGDANFIKVDDPQPVTADLGQTALMGWAYLDLAAAAGIASELEPFIGIGAGVSRNALGPVLYEFPTLTQPAWTLLPGGTRYSPAVGIAAGLAQQLSDSLILEVAYRWVRYGRVATDAGEVSQRRGGPETSFDVDETRAILSTHAVMVSLRWALGR